MQGDVAATDLCRDAWWSREYRARAVPMRAWEDGRKQAWRDDWRPFQLSDGWSEPGSSRLLTAPEVFTSLQEPYRVRRVRSAADHDVLATMAGATLIYREVGPPSVLRPYAGRELPLTMLAALDEGIFSRGTRLTADDVLRVAWPRFRLAWRALDTLADLYAWSGMDDDGHALTPLSRFQLGPWCALGEDRATMFCGLLREHGIIVPVAAPEAWHGQPGTVFGIARPTA